MLRREGCFLPAVWLCWDSSLVVWWPSRYFCCLERIRCILGGNDRDGRTLLASCAFMIGPLQTWMHPVSMALPCFEKKVKENNRNVAAPMRREDTYDLLSCDKDFFSACWWNLMFFTMLALNSSKPLETRINQLLWSNWWGNLTAGSSVPLQVSAFFLLLYELILNWFCASDKEFDSGWLCLQYTDNLHFCFLYQVQSLKKWSGQDALSVAAPPTSLSVFGPAALNFNSHIKLQTNLQTNSKRNHEQHKAATQTNTNFCGTPVLKNNHQSRLGPFEPHHETLHWVSDLDDESHREACLAEACNSVTTCRK